jgi:hypothetical protein
MHHYVGNTLQIRFLEGHKLVLRKGGFVVHDLTVAVEYQFANDGEHRRFQEDLRGRKLVSGFEFNQVCSKRAPRFGESETRQDLKIWRRKDGNRLHTLSFFSTAVRRHLEYPVCWFEPVTLKTVLGSERPSNTITIMFVRGDGESQMVRISRKRSWSLRRVWSWKSPSAGKYNLPDSKVNKELIVIGSSPTTTAISSPRNSSRTSISSLHSFQSRDTNSDDDRYPPGDVPITIEYFTIKFSTNGGT